MINILRQFFKFGIVGLINTILTYLIYSMLYKATSPTFAMAIGYGITSIIGLTINQKWVFKANHDWMIVVKYYLTYFLTWTLSILVTEVASNYFHVIASIIPLITLLVTTPTNFLLSKYWVFRKNELKEASANE
ncbi:GtrA family protein [Apilactobacillus kunkeei]|uniref:GtrA family protein n=1 Tax=Apilactobacillus kunkeei TaxID=148814 RepID=UPI00110D110A|nr:GtrA family protein [Apilactobacillus kunkeei]TMT01686.1 GtrA family protein [Apilactobacillus kunkeei]